jgi:REP element-mobilizing transposase RayT
MTYNPNIHHRRSIRLKGYNYTQAGAYFITICVYGRKHLFGSIVNGEVHLNQYGRIARDEWLKTSAIRPNIRLGEFVIMPNHFHAIIIIDDNGECRGESHLSTGTEVQPDDNHATYRRGESHSPPRIESHSPPRIESHLPPPIESHSPMASPIKKVACHPCESKQVIPLHILVNDETVQTYLSVMGQYLLFDHGVLGYDDLLKEEGDSTGKGECDWVGKGECDSPLRRGSDLPMQVGSDSSMPGRSDLPMQVGSDSSMPGRSDLPMPVRSDLPMQLRSDSSMPGRSDSSMQVGSDSPLRSPSKTVGAIVRGYKSSVTKQINKLQDGLRVWHRNYYDIIIRDETSFDNISNYIINNPAKWEEDRFFGENNTV